MIIELIICVSSFLALLLILKCSNVALFSLCILSVFCSGYYYSYTADQRAIKYILMKMWTGIKFSYIFSKRMHLFCRDLFSSTRPISSSLKPPVKLCGETLTLENEINTFAHNISKYYICSWYNKISDNNEFDTNVNSSIQEALLRLCYSVSDIKKKEFIYSILQLYLHFFSHFIEAMKSSESFILENFQFKHWAMKDSSTEWCYLQSLVSALLDKCGPTKMENSLCSKANSLLHTMVIEILTETLIQPLVRVLCNPLRINSLISKILSENSNEIVTSVETSFEISNLQPSVVLPKEDFAIDTNSETNVTFSQENELCISSMCSSSQICINEYNHEPDDIGFRSFPLLLSTKLKSSSNSYLYDLDFSDLSELEINEHLSMSCDASVIKRSKSADYIRQMPQLRALNEKDYDIKLQKGNNMMIVALKSENNANCNVEQAEEAVEIPSLFTDVKITEVFQQNVEGFMPYTLYCIQYTALFHDTSSSPDAPQFVTHEVCIKRRFREFVALQSRLEDNPVLKNYLKGIKGPSKWLTLPFSNLDKKNIAERKGFLEGYLKELCNIASIAQSSELQEFLAYGGDARISFAKRAGDINVPRIDKFFVRGVRGAIDIFKTALPNSGLEVEGILPIKLTSDDATADQRFQEHLLDFSSREPEIKEHIKNYIQNSMGNASFFYACEEWKHSVIKSKKSSLLRNLPNFRAEHCCTCPKMHDKYCLEENPFGSTVIELFDLAVDFNSLKFGGFLKTWLSSFAASINSVIENEVETISEERLARSLHFLHEYLWPNEINRNELNTYEDNFPNMDKVTEHLDDLFSSKFLTHNNIYSVKNALLEKIKLLLLSLQNEKANKCLLFHMFDIVIEYVC